MPMPDIPSEPPWWSAELVSTAAYHEAGHAVAVVAGFRGAAWLPRPPPPLPVTYGWVGENRPLLAEFCRHCAHADEIALDLREVRTRLAALRKRSAVDADSAREHDEAFHARNALLRLHGYLSERIGNLATKLRLTNQARYSSSRAADQHRRRAGGGRPWDDWES
jgi:hypothetical protein